MRGAPQSRLFVALWPAPPVRHLLRVWRDAWDWPRGATPVEPERLHLTLHFLGSVAVERIVELRAALALPFQPFELQFGQSSTWPHAIAVLEPLTVPEPLVQLHEDLGRVLARLGMPVEARTYKPHVTMARRAVKAVAPGSGPALTWAVDSYALVESNAGRYTVLETYE